MKRLSMQALGVVVTCALTTNAGASVSIVLLGSAAPPRTLGGMAMVPAIPDPAPLFATTTAVTIAPGKQVLFGAPVFHLMIGSGWGSWSHGYTGDVYYTQGALSMTMGFGQADVDGFYFYVESGPFTEFLATIVVSAGPGQTMTATQIGHGLSGAVGFGVVATDGRKIDSIGISMISTLSGAGLDFSVGEFGWHKTIPAPGAMALLAVASLAGRRRRL